jgi:hypothetical protein
MLSIPQLACFCYTRTREVVAASITFLFAFVARQFEVSGWIFPGDFTQLRANDKNPTSGLMTRQMRDSAEQSHAQRWKID